jgi:hypothetical protein
MYFRDYYGRNDKFCFTKRRHVSVIVYALLSLATRCDAYFFTLQTRDRKKIERASQTPKDEICTLHTLARYAVPADMHREPTHLIIVIHLSRPTQHKEEETYPMETIMMQSLF